MKGTIKFFKPKKGFGFIKSEDESEVFFHKSAVENNTYLEEGDNVTFDIEEGDRGKKAINVKKE
jgi:cold shock protein